MISDLSAYATGAPYRFTSAETWAAIRAGAGTNLWPVAHAVSAQFNTTGWSSLARDGIIFDTSTLPALPVQRAWLEVYPFNIVDQFVTAGIVIVPFTPGTPGSVVIADYANFGSTAYSAVIQESTLVLDQYNTIELNAAGLNAINPGGYTNFGIRLEEDRSGTSPSAAGSQQVTVELRQAGHANTPKLHVEQFFPSSTFVL